MQGSRRRPTREKSIAKRVTIVTFNSLPAGCGAGSQVVEKTIATIEVLEAFEKSDGCPLCSLWAASERSLVERAEANEVTMDPDFRSKVVASSGFCNRHMHLLFEVSFSGHTENGLAYALYSNDVVAGLERSLRSIYADNHITHPPTSDGFLAKRPTSRDQAKQVSSKVSAALRGSASCPICEILVESEQRVIRTFLSMLADDEFAGLYSKSAGICFPHFASSLGLLTREKKESESVVPLLYRKQLMTLASVRNLLEGRIRKYSWEHRDEVISPEEADAQRAALGMIAGTEGLYCRDRKVTLPG